MRAPLPAGPGGVRDRKWDLEWVFRELLHTPRWLGQATDRSGRTLVGANLFACLRPAGKVSFELQFSGQRRFGQTSGRVLPVGEHGGERQGGLDRPDDLAADKRELAPGAWAATAS